MNKNHTELTQGMLLMSESYVQINVQWTNSITCEIHGTNTEVPSLKKNKS